VDVVLLVILLVSAVVVGCYDTYAVQRDYADLFAARHGHIPPLVDWFFQKDADVEVEALRRLHRNLSLLAGALAAGAAIVALYIRATTPG
jgi:hypothetical protein